MIEIKDLFFSYDKFQVLQNVNLEVKKGEFIGIIGPNGGGKTTLLKLIMNFLKPNKGKISVHGTIGYAPQVHRTDRDFPITVEQLILLGALSKTTIWGHYPESIKTEAHSMMQHLGLLPYKNKVFGSLSGGLAQRTLLARALLSDPDLLLLDEPTANIDPLSCTLIYNLLDLLKRKKTILLVTHDLNTAIATVDRILCVQGTVNSFLPKEVCEHFALGLYHTPLLGLPPHHLTQEQEHVS